MPGAEFHHPHVYTVTVLDLRNWIDKIDLGVVRGEKAVTFDGDDVGKLRQLLRRRLASKPGS